MSVHMFDVLKVMAKRGMNIRAFNLFDNLKRANRFNKDGEIVLGVDGDTASSILAQSMGYRNDSRRVKGMLLVVNEEQYEQVLKELSEGFSTAETDKGK